MKKGRNEKVVEGLKKLYKSSLRNVRNYKKRDNRTAEEIRKCSCKEEGKLRKGQQGSQ